MRTSSGMSAKALGLLVVGAALTAAGCAKVEDTVRGFAAGSKSREKKGAVAASTTNASAQPAPATPAAASAPAAVTTPPAPAALPSALADPAVATKSDSAAVYGVNDPVPQDLPGQMLYPFRGMRTALRTRRNRRRRSRPRRPTATSHRPRQTRRRRITHREELEAERRLQRS